MQCFLPAFVLEIQWPSSLNNVMTRRLLKSLVSEGLQITCHQLQYHKRLPEENRITWSVATFKPSSQESLDRLLYLPDVRAAVINLTSDRAGLGEDAPIKVQLKKLKPSIRNSENPQAPLRLQFRISQQGLNQLGFSWGWLKAHCSLTGTLDDIPLQHIVEHYLSGLVISSETTYERMFVLRCIADLGDVWQSTTVKMLEYTLGFLLSGLLTGWPEAGDLDFRSCLKSPGRDLATVIQVMKFHQDCDDPYPETLISPDLILAVYKVFFRFCTSYEWTWTHPEVSPLYMTLRGPDPDLVTDLKLTVKNTSALTVKNTFLDDICDAGHRSIRRCQSAPDICGSFGSPSSGTQLVCARKPGFRDFWKRLMCLVPDIWALKSLPWP
jgi:hypothetical protein